MPKVTQSPLWNEILSTNKFKGFSLDNFKDNGANLRIAQYNHNTHGLFFLKNIIFNLASSFTGDQLKLLNKVPKRETGGGFYINFEEVRVDLDYLLALEEVLFLDKTLRSVESIVEIGGGYGRTCHTILSLYPNIKSYTIIDFKQMLELSGAYLKEVNCSFNKIKFVSVPETLNQKYDLAINIDSMQEMASETVKEYLQKVDEECGFFYSKNTVAKFPPQLCGWTSSKDSELALNSGILTDQIDVFNSIALREYKKKFVRLFRPSNSWNVLNEGDSKPWTHYYQALYKKCTK